jgi:hypothetical protein
MEDCLKHVSDWSCAILLQTRTVLSHSWPLLAVYRAALASVPVVCVVVNESGYDFGGAQLHLKHLSERLGAPALEQISQELSRWNPPRGVEALQSKLLHLIPKMISVAYNPNGTNHELMATCRDIEDKQKLLQRKRRHTFMDDYSLGTPVSDQSADGEAVAQLHPAPHAPPRRACATQA